MSSSARGQISKMRKFLKTSSSNEFFLTLSLIFCTHCILSASIATANPDAKRLYDDLLSNYNRLIRPVGNSSDRLTVKMGLKLSQIIGIDMKRQIMITNVWVEQEWVDYKLKWKPSDYGGVKHLHVPSQHIWLPDIVLYNNADGNYEVTIMTKAILHYSGKVVWNPPAIYKSSCEIDVEFFPFDEQKCFMKFGSWTYDGYMVDLRHINQRGGNNRIEMGMDLQEYYISTEWDIMTAYAVRNEKYYPCCEEPYPDIIFYLTLRRKSLFYTVNVIIPCVGISFLSVLVFYLPSDSGEKVSLSISILLSLTVFFLLLAEIIPSTSMSVPLLGKYLLFTMILVTFSVVVTIGVLNVNFRTPATHKMAPWVRKLFVDVLPKYLFIQRPDQSDDDDDDLCMMYNTNPSPPPPEDQLLPHSQHHHHHPNQQHHHQQQQQHQQQAPAVPPHQHHHMHHHQMHHNHHHVHEHDHEVDEDEEENIYQQHVHEDEKNELQLFPQAPHYDGCGGGGVGPGGYSLSPYMDQRTLTLQSRCDSLSRPRSSALNPALERAMNALKFVAQHVKNQDNFEGFSDDWKYVAMVLDRILLWMFTIACVVGTAGIIMAAPSHYDARQPIDILYSKIDKKNTLKRVLEDL